MKLTISRDALLAALTRVGRVVEKRNTIPILSNARLVATPGRLSITGTDLDMEIGSSVEADVSTPGETTIPAHMAAEIMRKFPDGATVELAQKADEPRLTLKSGRSRITVNTLSPADFPDLSAGPFDFTFQMPASALLAMLDRVSFAISNEETRYYLNGVYLHGTDGETGPMLRAVATDGHRLASHEILAPEGAQGLKGIILPRKAVGEVGRLANPLGEEKVTIEVSATKLRLTAGVATLTTKLIDGTFPDYSRVIPAGNDKVATLDKAALTAAVERVATVSTERGRAVRFSFAAGALTLTVTSPDTGDATDELDATYDAEGLDIGFNGRYVADILSSVPGESVKLVMADPGSPCLITPEAAGSGSLFVLMPMRV